MASARWDKLLDVLFCWWRVADNLPAAEEKASFVYCHTYSAYKDLTRLTAMSQASFAVAACLYNSKADYGLFSVARYGEAEELEMRERLLQFYNCDRTRANFLCGAKSTYDEVLKVVNHFHRHSGDSLIVVADRYHLRRSLRVFRKILPYGVKLYWASSKCKIYETPFHPGLQGFSIRFKIVHIIWNIVFSFTWFKNT